jgi:DNA-binding response OmpR family regulator
MARILVVDDDPSIRVLIKETLVLAGHAVDMAGNGYEAITCARKNAYDLVIMDREMPQTNGIQALRTMRRDVKLKNLKVIMCTGASMVKQIDESFQAGANDYTIKPINLDILMAKVKTLLDKV